jgi:hypothetical protein
VKKGLVIAAACAAMLATSQASAQKYMATGVAETASGVEGGGGYQQSLGRARTRARIGAELYIDESPADVLSGAFLLDIEPRSAFGVDARYMRVFATRWAFGAGAIGYVQPGTLVGPVGMGEYRHTISQGFALAAGPEANVFVLGSDLPDKTVVWQALFKVGLRVGF